MRHVSLRLLARFAAAVLVVTALSACAKAPSKVFLDLQDAARKGDAEAFAANFSEDSQPFARALLALYDSQYPAGGPAPRPLDQLTLMEVQKETIDGDKAELEVKAQGGAPVVLVFVKEKGHWRLDVDRTDREGRNTQDEE